MQQVLQASVVSYGYKWNDISRGRAGMTLNTKVTEPWDT